MKNFENIALDRDKTFTLRNIDRAIVFGLINESYYIILYAELLIEIIKFLSSRKKRVFLLFSTQFYKMSQGNSADFESVNSILPFEWCLDFEVGIKLRFASLLPSKRYYAVKPY